MEKVVTFPWILHSTKTQSIFLFSLSKSLQSTQTKCAVDSSYSAWKCGAHVNEMHFVVALGFGSSRIFVGFRVIYVVIRGLKPALLKMCRDHYRATCRCTSYLQETFVSFWILHISPEAVELRLDICSNMLMLRQIGRCTCKMTYTSFTFSCKRCS